MFATFLCREKIKLEFFSGNIRSVGVSSVHYSVLKFLNLLKLPKLPINIKQTKL